jgi:hypothetical protein
MSLVVLNAGPG